MGTYTRVHSWLAFASHAESERAGDDLLARPFID